MEAPVAKPEQAVWTEAALVVEVREVATREVAAADVALTAVKAEAIARALG